jgi:hypothetical protein
MKRISLTLLAGLAGVAGAKDFSLAVMTRAASEEAVQFLKFQGYAGAEFKDANANGVYDEGEITLRDYQGDVLKEELYKALDRYSNSLKEYKVKGHVRGAKSFYVVIQNSKGMNLLNPVKGEVVFDTWFEDIGFPTAVDGRVFVQARSGGNRAWIDVAEGGKYKGQYNAKIGKIRHFSDGYFYMATNAQGQQNVMKLPKGKPVSDVWQTSAISDYTAGDGYVYFLTGGSWFDADKGRPVGLGPLSEVKGLFFSGDQGALWGKTAGGEWGNVDVRKGKPLGKGLQADSVGPLQTVNNEPAFKSCQKEGCNLIKAKGGEDILSKLYEGLGNKVFHFEGRDLIQAKDKLGRYTYVDIQKEEPLTGAQWFQSLEDPETTDGIFRFVATTTGGEKLWIEVTPEGLTSRKPYKAGD